MRIVNHGGACCGVKHLHGFPNFNPRTHTVAWLRAEIDRAWDEPGNGNGGVRGRILECVLTADQVAQGWAPVLREFGFLPVSSWLNENSGNVCYMFHYHPEAFDRGADAEPDQWDDALPRLEPQVVRQEFINVYRNSRGTSRFPTLEAANAVRSAGRRVGVERIDYFDDGSQTTTMLDNG